MGDRVVCIYLIWLGVILCDEYVRRPLLMMACGLTPCCMTAGDMSIGLQIPCSFGWSMLIQQPDVVMMFKVVDVGGERAESSTKLRQIMKGVDSLSQIPDRPCIKI